jgi:hypothetical protein
MKTENEFIEIPEEHIDRVIGNYNPVVIITTNNAQRQTYLLDKRILAK